MSNSDDIKILTRIKKTHERIVLIAGIGMGVALSTYFFTFGMLIDNDSTVLLWFQMISSIVFIFGLIYIKALAFLITKIILGFNSENSDWLGRLKIVDMDKDVEELVTNES